MTREKLQALFARRWPEPITARTLATKTVSAEPSKFDDATLYAAWAERRTTFQAFLNIGTDEAFLAAAMMCRPRGWRSDLRIYPSGFTEIDLNHDTLGRSLGLDAPTPAEALIEAITKAMNDGNI